MGVPFLDYEVFFVKTLVSWSLRGCDVGGPSCVLPRGVTYVLIRFCNRSPDTEQLTPQARYMSGFLRSLTTLFDVTTR